MIFDRRIWTAFCLFLLVTLSAPVAAQENGPFADFFAAADQLDRLAGAASSAGAPPPRMSDPQVASLLARMTTASQVFNRTYRMEDLPELLRVLNRTGGFLRLYAAWGDPGGLSEAVRTNQDNRNTVLYQNEVVPLFGFLFENVTQMLRTVSANISTIPAERRAGIAGARDGLIQMVDGMLGLIELPGITPDHQLAIALVLDRDAADLASALSLSQRGAMASRLEVMRGRVGPQARVAIDRALRAFNNTACTGVCAI